MAVPDIESIRGDAVKRNELIEQYKPFIANCVYSVTHKRVEYGVDDELSIALMGFNHAIDKYDGRGSFLSFAKLVIKNRLYDYFRLNNRHLNAEPLYDEEDKENYKLVDRSMVLAREDDDTADLREEIEDLNARLKEVGIQFIDLVKLSPKHKAKRKKINEVVRFILQDEEAMRYFNNTHNIPMKRVEDSLNISRKNIEPYRKYLVALMVIATSDFYFLKEYLSL